MIRQGEAIDNAGDVVSQDDITELTDALTATTSDLAYAAIIEQYGPDWALADTLSLQYTDAVQAGSYLVRAGWTGSTWVAQRLLSGATTWGAITLSVVPPAGAVITLAANGSEVKLFYASATEVRSLTCANIAASSPQLGSDELVLTLANVKGLAAVTTSELYLAYLNAQSNRVLAAVSYADSAWTKTDSDVYWPFPFDSFDAVKLSDRVIVAFSGDLPPLWGTRAVGVTVTSYFQRVQGIILFTVRNGRWSDFITHDVIDRDVTGYSRRNLRLSLANGYIFMTYDRHMIFRKSDDSGALLLDNSSVRIAPVVSRSMNGRDWEFPEAVILTTAPFVVLPLGDYLYALSARTYRSHACSWAGMTPRAQDVSDYVLDVASRAGDIRSTTVEMANPYKSTGGLPSTVLNGTLIDSNLRLTLKVFLGYYVPVTI